MYESSRPWWCAGVHAIVYERGSNVSESETGNERNARSRTTENIMLFTLSNDDNKNEFQVFKRFYVQIPYELQKTR